jgi:hypothetical protein
VGTDGDFSLFFVLLIILPNLQDFTRPFFLFFFFFRKWRASAAASLNEARARTLAGAGIFFLLVSLFLLFIQVDETRENAYRMSETNTQILYTPPFTFRIGTPHHFLPVCVTYWRGERESSKKLSQEFKKKNIISYLKKTRPSQRLFSLLRVTCTQFTSPLIRLDFFFKFLFFFCETETSKDQRQKYKIRRKKKGRYGSETTTYNTGAHLTTDRIKNL